MNNGGLMFRIKIAFVLLLIFALLTSCNAKKYSDDVSCYELCEYAIAAIDEGEDFSDYGKEYIKYFFENSELHDDFRIVYSTETDDIDELGIFHAPSADAAKEISAIAQNYISEMQNTQRAFIGSYAPEELPKLDNAEVRVFGNYVVYAIMEDDEKSEAFSAIDKKLLSK